MLSMTQDRDPVAVFRSAAERYIAVIDAAEGQSEEQLSADLVCTLPVLYEAALGLPKPVVEMDELPEARLTHEQWGEIFGRLQRVFGADDLYWTVVPSGEDEREELAGSLADDLADIYRDVKEGLDLLAAGESMNEVVWHWRFNFWTHWGTHAVDALRVIHVLLADLRGPL
jgi:Domain of unknown function (DUF5063)